MPLISLPKSLLRALSCVLLLGTAAAVQAVPQTIDKIIAVVNDGVVLQSELDRSMKIAEGTLRDYFFDVTRSDGGFEASLRCDASGAPERVPAHRKLSHANGERITVKTPQTDQVEGQLIEGLARLAQSLQPPPVGPR